MQVSIAPPSAPATASSGSARLRPLQPLAFRIERRFSSFKRLRDSVDEWANEVVPLCRCALCAELSMHLRFSWDQPCLLSALIHTGDARKEMLEAFLTDMIALARRRPPPSPVPSAWPRRLRPCKVQARVPSLVKAFLNPLQRLPRGALFSALPASSSESQVVPVEPYRRWDPDESRRFLATVDRVEVREARELGGTTFFAVDVFLALPDTTTRAAHDRRIRWV